MVLSKFTRDLPFCLPSPASPPTTTMPPRLRKRAITPAIEEVAPQKQKPTPVKSKIKGAINYCNSIGLKRQKARIFRFHDIPKTTGYRICKSDDRTLKNILNPRKKETRGRKKLISPEKLKKMEYILETEGIEARALTWEQLAFEVGLKLSKLTVMRALGSLDYSKCVACVRGWVSPKLA